MAGYSTVKEVPPQYQVFINFHGEELRNGFVSHLVDALKRRKINAFYDRDEDKGEPLERLLKRIEESRIAVAILSINYNESDWCLRELAKMKECMGKAKLVIIPIFYKVRTATVKDMSGQLDKVIAGLDGGDATTNKKEWEEALKWITSLTGFRVKNDSNENKKIQKVVEEVYKRLNKIQLEDGKVKSPNIQVFINFLGEQLRNNFFGYLVNALRRSEINVLIDNQEQRGEALNTILKRRIEDSEIAIVVFSSRYAASKWCLDELVKIQERVDQGLLKVLPIFYKVTPDNVKRLEGNFGDHFRDYEHRYRFDEPKINRWREAIAFVSHQFGLTFDEKSSVLEVDFIETIVKEVLKMAQAISTVESGQSSG